MRPNVGKLDQIARFIVGALLAVMPSIWSLGTWGSWTAYVIGGVLIATSVFSFCPIYAVLGLSTRRPPRNRLTDVKGS